MSFTAEQALLGALLAFPDHPDITRVFSLLAPECFDDPRHRIIFDLLSSYAPRTGKVRPRLEVAEQLESTGPTRVDGGAAYIEQLVDFAATASNWAHHARFVREAWVRRQLRRIGELDPGRALDTPALLREADAILAETQLPGENHEPTRCKHLLWAELERIENARQTGGADDRWLGTGIPGLDGVLRGWPVGRLSLVVGPRGVGRTTFAMTTALATVMRQEPTLVISSDQDGRRLTCRAMALSAELPMWKIESGSHAALKDADYRPLALGAGALSAAPLCLAGGTAPSLATIRAMVHSHEIVGEYRLVVLDGCDEMMGSGIDQYLRGLKLLAEETGTAIVVTLAVDGDDRLTLVPGTPELHPVALFADVFVRLSDVRTRDGRRRTGDRLVRCGVEWNRCGHDGEVILQFKANRTRFERPLPTKAATADPDSQPPKRKREARRRRTLNGDSAEPSLL